MTNRFCNFILYAISTSYRLLLNMYNVNSIHFLPSMVITDIRILPQSFVAGGLQHFISFATFDSDLKFSISKSVDMSQLTNNVKCRCAVLECVNHAATMSLTWSCINWMETASSVRSICKIDYMHGIIFKHNPSSNFSWTFCHKYAYRWLIG